jgi:hypothetical protein
MKTILYRIPDIYFPGVFVKKPFHAKVNYKIEKGKVVINDVTISPLCMEHIHSVDVLRKQMQADIEAVEAKRELKTLQALTPFI